MARRKFLMAAALGTAAASLIGRTGEGVLQFGPLTALANDLSGNPCTAQDVEIVGTGVVQNEPCSCTGGATFTAHVQFTVRNNTSTGRYCIALHLPSGFGVPAQDVILRDANGSSTAPGKSNTESFHDTVMFGDVTGFPCNTGGTLVCIGQQGVTTGKCAPNACTTIAWNTSPGAAGCTTADQKPPGGQCRHQGVCIQGFGAALVCKSGCTQSCGGTSVLTASVSGGSSPYFFTLSGSDGSSQRFPATGTTTDTSHDFSVSVTQSTTYTLTVTDSLGCSRTASTSLTAAPISVALGVAGNTNCDGKLTFTATVTGGSGTNSYTFKVDGVAAANQPQASNTFAYGPVLDGTCHTISVDVSSGSCTGSASKTVSQCASTTLDCV
jgi:hypothetical protein